MEGRIGRDVWEEDESEEDKNEEYGYEREGWNCLKFSWWVRI